MVFSDSGGKTAGKKGQGGKNKLSIGNGFGDDFLADFWSVSKCPLLKGFTSFSKVRKENAFISEW